jgi:hypothetical protein
MSVGGAKTAALKLIYIMTHSAIYIYIIYIKDIIPVQRSPHCTFRI